MNPLDAATPAELFGEAVGDARKLKKAYARWIKKHDPESDPVAFEHIRRLYEQAVEALTERPVERPPEPVASADPLAGDWEDADTLLARLALGTDAESVKAEVGISEAVDPAGTFARLRARIEDHPELVRSLLKLLLVRDPERVDVPELEAILAAAGREHRGELRAVVIEAELELGRYDAALARWQAHEVELMHLGSRGGALYVRILGGVSWKRPDAHDLLAKAMAASFPIDDATYWSVVELDATLAAVQDAEGVPVALMDTLSRGWSASGWVKSCLVRELTEALDLWEALPELERRHPAVVRALARFEDDLTGWKAAGRRARDVFDIADLSAPSPPALTELEDELEQAKSTGSVIANRSLFQRVAVIAACLIGAFVLARFRLLPLAGIAAVGAFAAFIWTLAMLWADPPPDPADLERCGRASWSPVVRRLERAQLEALLSYCAAEGVWPWECLGPGRAIDPRVDAAFNNRAALLHHLGDEHQRRILWGLQ